MKKSSYILYLFLFLGCSNGIDCFQNYGETVSKSYEIDDFSRVIFREGVELELKEGTKNTIEISYGKNFIDNISSTIKNDKLIIENSTTCNLTTEKHPAKVVLTAKKITEIRNASQFKCFSKDTLRFESLSLISEDFIENEVNVGDFELLIDNKNLNIVTNGVSNFSLSGKTENLNINFAAGQGKFNGKHLISENIYVFHRGSNNLVIHPVKVLKGEIRSIGDLISVNRPPTVDVERFYTGKLIFKD